VQQIWALCVMGDTLELEVLHAEEVGWRQLSHLRDWAPDTQRLRLIVPPAVSSNRLLDTVRLAGNCFQSLQHLEASGAAEWCGAS
jgi:hypothetical protein